MPVKRHALRFYGIPSEVVVTLLYLFILFVGHLVYRELFNLSADLSERNSFWHFDAPEWYFIISPVFLFLILRNIYGENRSIKKELIDRERWFETLFEQGNDAILVIDESFRIVDCNARAIRFFNVSGKDKVVGKTPLDFSPEIQSDGQSSIAKAAELSAALFKGEPQQFVWQHLQNSGELIEAEISLSLVVVEENKYMQAILRDITARKIREERIQWFNRLIEHSLNEIYVFDAETLHFIEVNRGAKQNIGYSMRELRGMTPLDIKPEMTAESFEQTIAPLRNGESEMVQFETVHLRKDGSAYPVEVHLEYVENHPSVFVAMILDISMRRKAEKELQRLSMAIHQAAESVVITDAQGTIEYVNPAVEVVTGYSSEQLIGKNPRVLKSGLHKDAFYKAMWSQISSGRSWKGVFKNRHKNGNLYHEECFISPVQDEHGEIVNYVAVKRDITKELNLQDQIRQSQKMEAVGLLAGGIAHDFNNILQTILGSCEMLMMQTEEQPALHQDALEIMNAGRSASHLIRQLLTFSRKDQVQFAQVDLNQVVENQQNMLSRLLDNNVSLVFKAASGLKPVWADSGQLEQVVMNLVVNARDAMPRGGTIVIRTENTEKQIASEMPQSCSAEYVCLTVSDSGEGMSQQVVKRLFEPFFTTKTIGERGTGLGLSIVYGIVQQHKGWIDVESMPGKGTEFRIHFPVLASGDPEVQPDREDDQQIVDRRRYRILLVEDDPDLKRSMAYVLHSAGYEVFDVETAEHAASLLRTKKMDLLITDVDLPGLSGIELGAQFAVEQKDLPVIISSGHDEECIDMQTIINNDFIFIKKPFKSLDLISLIERVFCGEKSSL